MSSSSDHHMPFQQLVARKTYGKRARKTSALLSTPPFAAPPPRIASSSSSDGSNSDMEVVASLVAAAPAVSSTSSPSSKEKGKGRGTAKEQDREQDHLVRIGAARGQGRPSSSNNGSAKKKRRVSAAVVQENSEEEVETMSSRMSEDVDPRRRKPSMLSAMQGRTCHPLPGEAGASPVSPLKHEVFLSSSIASPSASTPALPISPSRRPTVVQPPFGSKSPFRRDPVVVAIATSCAAASPVEIIDNGYESPVRRKRPRATPKKQAAVDSTSMQAITGVSPSSSIAILSAVASTSTLPTRPVPASPVRSKTKPTLAAPSTPKRPASPTKDLSKVFEMFAELVPDMERSDDALKKGTGMIAMLGARSTPTPLSSPQSSRQRLQRSSSAPDIGNTPPPPTSPRRSAMPNSASKKALGATNSMPALLATNSASSSLLESQNGSSRDRSRETSPMKSQSRMINRTGMTGSTGLGGAASGSRRTYGGARSFKRDDEEERMFGLEPTFGAASDATAKLDGTSANGSSLLASTFPSLSFGGGAARGLLPVLPRPTERDTYSSLRRQWGADSDEETEESQRSGTGKDEASELKSITQLRARGENTRFVDEFNYLVEGLAKGVAVGIRRASAIEVLRKILDVEFVRRLKASGFVERVYLEFRKAEAGDGDRVLDPCIAFLIAFLSRDQNIVEPLLRVTPIANPLLATDEDTLLDEPICEVLVILCAMMERSWATEEIGKAGVKGLSKIEIRTLATVREIIDKSRLIDDPSLPITLRSLCLIAISIIASFTPRSIFQPHRLICSSGTLDVVIKFFIDDTQSLETRISRFENGLDLLPADGSISLSLIDTSLRIIEVCIAADPSASYILLAHLTAFTSSLSSLLHVCHILCRTSDVRLGALRAARDCRASSLRMLIELTTMDLAWSIGFASTGHGVATLVSLIECARLDAGRERNESVAGKKQDEDSEKLGREDAGQFDVLCLALGVLTNLVETVESTKDVLRAIHISTTCTGARQCVRTCQCVDRQSAIHRLTDLYLDPFEDSNNPVEVSFINGYSAILLGLVMLDSLENQSMISTELRRDQEATKRLIEAMKEFAELHEVAAANLVDVEADGEESEQHSGADANEGGGAASSGASEVASRIRSMLASFR